jgi:molybdopterin/thiamine biosynthesis adenylyltransferase
MSNRLEPSEKQRYNRQIILPSWGEEAQKKLKTSCVFIAGMGGLGSPVAAYLAAAGVGRLRICDSGKVELSNLNRQFLHGDETLGEKKVVSAAQSLKRINRLVEVVPLYETIRSANIESLVADARLMIDCLACLIAQAPPAATFPILGATAGLLGSLQAMEALKFLTGSSRLLKGRLLFCDAEAMQFEEVAFEKDPQCTVCGAQAEK